MLEMKITIAVEDTLVAAINNLAQALKAAPHPVTQPAESGIQPPVTPVASVPTSPVNTTPVPTGAPQYTLEMISVAGSALIDAGKLDALMALLGKYGVDSLTNLDPSMYGAMATDLRVLGARI